MKKQSKLFSAGNFFLGCNWWASHAGTNTWSDWRADVVEADMKKLKAAGLDVVRVFPLWSDFQPIKIHYGGGNSPREVRIGEMPLPHTEAGRAGIDPVMAERFGKLCNIAERNGIRLIVALVTGWMSGRLHAPEAFAGRNLLQDPFVIKWQLRFVKYMVRNFKDKPAVVAWDLGNECNVLSSLGGAGRSGAYLWASAITDAIKSIDGEHPVISGMHATFPDESAHWNAADLGEILDALCTHPYPLFTPHCDTDPLNEMKTILHSTAETLLYEGTSGKPAFIEEIGTLGPMVASEAVAGDYARVAMFSAWAHDLHGFLWWCANEQSHLTHTPYDWNAVERELGLFHLDGTPKPVLDSMSEMARFLSAFKFGSLPPRIKDAVCILTEGIDTWSVAYGSFILAKKAGLDISFAWCRDEIPESPIYLLPSLSGDSSMSLHVWRELIRRAEAGATLYVSIDDALLSPFSELFGMRVVTREKLAAPDTVTMDGQKLRFDPAYRLLLESVGATVVLRRDDGTAAASEYSLGKGRVCFVAAPIEARMGTGAGLASGKGELPYHKIYELFHLRSREKVASSSSATVAVTEHVVDADTRLLTVINYRPEEQSVEITLDGGYSLSEVIEIHGKTSVSRTAKGFLAKPSANNGFVAVIKNKIYN